MMSGACQREKRGLVLSHLRGMLERSAKRGSLAIDRGVGGKVSGKSKRRGG